MTLQICAAHHRFVLDQIDTVNEAGEHIGWTALLEFVVGKLNLIIAQDVGTLAVNFLTKLRRNSGEDPGDWICRFEKAEREL